jgi:hypothetical protein
MRVLVFLSVTFQEGAWKQGWAEAGRITYKASQEHALVEIEVPGRDSKLKYRVGKGTKMVISGNSIHLPAELR